MKSLNKFFDSWQAEYVRSRNEFEQKGRAHAESYMSTLNPVEKFLLENFWFTKKSAIYEAAWGYLQNN